MRYTFEYNRMNRKIGSKDGLERFFNFKKTFFKNFFFSLNFKKRPV